VALVIERGHFVPPGVLRGVVAGVADGVASLAPADSLGLLMVDRRCHLLAPPTQVGASPSWVAACLGHVAPAEGANLCGGWLNARQLLEEAPWIVGQHAASMRRIVLCVTGHIDTGIADASTLVELARNALARGISTSILALGPQANTPLLEAMAAAGGGTCHPVGGLDEASAGDVASAIAAERRQMGRRALRGLTVRLVPSEGVTIEEVPGGMIMRRQDGSAGMTLVLGELQSEQEVVLPLRLRCPTPQRGRLRGARAPLLMAHVEGERFTARGGTEYRTVVVPVHEPSVAPS
jgi:hypothetical protein